MTLVYLNRQKSKHLFTFIVKPRHLSTLALTGKDTCLPDIFSVKKHQQGQLDHVPAAAAIVVHQVERQRHM